MKKDPESKPVISPKTKIGELLDAWPHLEEVLIGMSPVFEKLKNPVLRRTVARVATIQQVAVVGGIPVEEIVNRLRSETGQEVKPVTDSISPEVPGVRPAWYDEGKIVDWYDASPVINEGGSPMADILSKAGKLNQGEILELQTPFMPAPIIDMLHGKNYRTWSIRKEEIVYNYITKS